MRLDFKVLGVAFVISYNSLIFIAVIVPPTSRGPAEHPYVKQLRRLMSISRLPIYSHFSEVLSGVGMIDEKLPEEKI